MAEPSADISNLVERPVISIDGQAYELRSTDELNPIEGKLLDRLRARILAMEELEEPTEADGKTLKAAYVELAQKLAVDIPADVAARLTPNSLRAMYLVFLRLPLSILATATAGASPSTGTTTSPS